MIKLIYRRRRSAIIDSIRNRSTMQVRGPPNEGFCGAIEREEFFMVLEGADSFLLLGFA
jgi:hypothetical protein